MRSKTSFFEPTLFRKNLTRFAPAWGLYTLCLVLGILLIYSNGGIAKQYHFASNLMDLVQILGGVNLVYGALVAQLLFGDLYTNRMCYALHAMPVRRESLFYTNLASGFLFSLLPTLVMSLVSLPLLADSCFADAWKLPLYVFAGANLSFACFFGLGVFSAMCVGNRLSMVVVYGLLNFGAAIAYWLIDTVYTPLLYGVVTPDQWAQNLTPVSRIVGFGYFEAEMSYYELDTLYMGNWNGVRVGYSLFPDNWKILMIWAAAGFGFMILAMMLYKKRDLETAGDAMAFKVLEPVFQILVALVCAAAAQFFVSEFLGLYDQYHYIVLATGLLVGWFGCRMLIERGTRVFRLRNWIGFAGLTVALALSLFCTQIDIFGIEVWQPKVEDVARVELNPGYAEQVVLEDPQDIEAILRLQKLALDSRVEESGPYVEGLDGTLVQNIDTNANSPKIDPDEITDCVLAAPIHICYTLKNGREVYRKYVIWSEGEAGDIAREYLSRWDSITARHLRPDGKDVLEEAIRTMEGIYIDGVSQLPAQFVTEEFARGLVAAIQADCEDRTMTQDYRYHSGSFRMPEEYLEENKEYGYSTNAPELWLAIHGKEESWSINIFADSEHSLNFLRQHGLLRYDVMENNFFYY